MQLIYQSFARALSDDAPTSVVQLPTDGSVFGLDIPLGTWCVEKFDIFACVEMGPADGSPGTQVGSLRLLVGAECMPENIQALLKQKMKVAGKPSAECNKVRYLLGSKLVAPPDSQPYAETPHGPVVLRDCDVFVPLYAN